MFEQTGWGALGQQLTAMPSMLMGQSVRVGGGTGIMLLLLSLSVALFHKAGEGGAAHWRPKEYMTRPAAHRSRTGQIDGWTEW